jgi:DNA repair protein RadC
MSIKNWPKEERPRERLHEQGPEALSDAELLAILLVTGASNTGLTALDCSRMLLKEHLSLRNLTRVSCAELCRIPGVGSVKASRIQAALEIGRRVVSQKRRMGTVFQISQDVFDTYSLRLRDAKQETFTVILLDSKNRYLREETVALGSLNQSIVHPREVFRPAIQGAAASVILVHNHPSGDPSPSDEDVRVTERLVEAGKLLGIQVLDHIIVGEGRYFSFFDQRRLDQERRAP